MSDFCVSLVYFTHSVFIFFHYCFITYANISRVFFYIIIFFFLGFLIMKCMYPYVCFIFIYIFVLYFVLFSFFFFYYFYLSDRYNLRSAVKMTSAVRRLVNLMDRLKVKFGQPTKASLTICRCWKGRQRFIFAVSCRRC